MHHILNKPHVFSMSLATENLNGILRIITSVANGYKITTHKKHWKWWKGKPTIHQRYYGKMRKKLKWFICASHISNAKSKIKLNIYVATLSFNARFFSILFYFPVQMLLINYRLHISSINYLRFVIFLLSSSVLNTEEKTTHASSIIPSREAKWN